jgi:hypothetical protein
MKDGSGGKRKWTAAKEINKKPIQCWKDLLGYSLLDRFSEEKKN